MESHSIMSQALAAYARGEFSSKRACAKYYGIPKSTFSDRTTMSTSRALAHVKEQFLTRAEEESLINTITRLCRTGFPTSPLLVRQLALEIRRSRLSLATFSPISTIQLDLPNPKWVQRLRNRHPELSSLYTRQIDASRFKALTYDTVRAWFDAVVEEHTRSPFTSEHIYNMDETGFCLGTSQSTRVIVNSKELVK